MSYMMYCLRRRETDLSWVPKDILKPLAPNAYKMYLPTRSLDEIGAAPEAPSGSSDVRPPRPRGLEAHAAKVDPPTTGAGPKTRGPYLSLLQQLDAAAFQQKCSIPVNGKSRKGDEILACNIPGCLYFSRSQAEKERHVRCHHAAIEEIPAAAEPAELPSKRPAYSLDGAAVVPPKKPKHGGDAENADDECDAPDAVPPNPPREEDQRYIDRVRGPMVNWTDHDLVRRVVGDEDLKCLRDLGFSILFGESLRAWRGFRRSKYIKGTHAALSKFPTEEDAIQHVLNKVMEVAGAESDS